MTENIWRKYFGPTVSMAAVAALAVFFTGSTATAQDDPTQDAPATHDAPQGDNADGKKPRHGGHENPRQKWQEKTQKAYDGAEEQQGPGPHDSQMQMPKAKGYGKQEQPEQPAERHSKPMPEEKQQEPGPHDSQMQTPKAKGYGKQEQPEQPAERHSKPMLEEAIPHDAAEEPKGTMQRTFKPVPPAHEGGDSLPNSYPHAKKQGSGNPDGSNATAPVEQAPPEAPRKTFNPHEADNPPFAPRRAKPDDGEKPSFHNIDDLRAQRRERKEGGGKRIVIQEADRRVIVRDGNRLVIQKDEMQQIRRVAPHAQTTRAASGLTMTIVRRPNGTQIVTETDGNGQLVRRYRRDRYGRETIIIDNRRRKSGIGRDVAIGVGVIAGAAILSSLVDIPPPRVRLPREKYVVDYENASYDDVYEALNAPPVDEIYGGYTLDQVRATRYLRERMRRIDLDDIHFETGSWDVDPSEYHKLERIARAMRRIIRRNRNEVIMVEGYTDAIGSDVDNLGLSDRRAEAVAAILTEEFDVPFENLTTQGYGEQFLKIETSRAERANRRVAIRRITPLIAGYRAGVQDDDGEPNVRRYPRRREDDGVDPY